MLVSLRQEACSDNLFGLAPSSTRRWADILGIKRCRTKTAGHQKPRCAATGKIFPGKGSPGLLVAPERKAARSSAGHCLRSLSRTSSSPGAWAPLFAGQ